MVVCAVTAPAGHVRWGRDGPEWSGREPDGGAARRGPEGGQGPHLGATRGSTHLSGDRCLPQVHTWSTPPAGGGAVLTGASSRTSRMDLSPARSPFTVTVPRETLPGLLSCRRLGSAEGLESGL